MLWVQHQVTGCVIKVYRSTKLADQGALEFQSEGWNEATQESDLSEPNPISSLSNTSKYLQYYYQVY